MPNQINFKQSSELYAIGALLDGKKIPIEKCISSDRPDIIIPISDSEAIGIEVVTYRSGNNAESEAAIYKIFAEYGRRMDKECSKKYDVTVWFRGGDIPTNLNFKTIKDTLFMEMDRCRFNHPDKVFNEYISSVNLYEVPNLEKTFVGLSRVFDYVEINNRNLEEVIANKDAKLKQYKIKQRDINITEWWLVIYFPTIENTDFLHWDTNSFSFTSDYDHIYLTEPGSNFIELK